jgi:hypothetical protein
VNREVGLKPSVYEFAAKIHFVRDIGRNNFLDRKHQAICEIYGRLNHEVCETCLALRVQLTGELGRLVFGNAARLRAFP